MWIGDVCRRPRALAAGIATSAAVSAGFGFAATPAMAAYRAQVSSGTLELVGDSASDKLSLELDPTDPSSLLVDVGEDGTVDFRLDRSTFSKIDVQAGAGDDEVRIGNAVGDVTVDGGPGDDTLIGGDGNDTLIGGAGDDVVTGGRGSDVVQLGAGSDTFIWNPGDGSDTVDGGSGHDVLDFNGSNAIEHIDVSANRSDVELTRDVGAVTMDLNGLEGLNLTARGGADDIAVHDLAGTDMTQTNVDLSGTPGSGTGDGAADTVTAFGTTGSDHATVSARDGNVIVSGLGAQLQVTGADPALDTVGVSTLGGDDTIDTGVGIAGPAAVDIDGGDGTDTVTYSGTELADTIALGPSGGGVATSDISGDGSPQVTTEVENLTVLGRGGADSITAGNGLAGLTNLTINGGGGDDTISGGDGNDVLIGGPGNDVVSGGRGNDTVTLGGGKDTFVWNPGDGSDAVDGGSGQDTLLFNGSNVGEKIALAANGSHVQLTRDVGAISLDLSGLEILDVTARGGADTLTVNDLTGTGVTRANLDLSGVPETGTGDGAADTVIVNGTEGPDHVDVTSQGADVLVSRLDPAVQIIGSESALDVLKINTLAGRDRVQVAPGVGQLITPIVDLGPDQ
jgi:Ca2+-binding RTX toxin-like protein